MVVGGKPMYLRSGELVYFRLPLEAWRDRLMKLKDCGGNAVSFYIPWNWHEPTEGEYDFRGRSHPSRDLAGFLEVAYELGLFLIVKPGPFICNEWRNGAIPQWLLDKHPEIRSLNSKGEFIRRGDYPPVSYLHPTYLEYIGKWYDQVCAVLSDVVGRNLLLIQPDNEVRLTYTLHDPFLSDYSVFVAGIRGEREGLYHQWVRRTHGDIRALNRAHGTAYEDFAEVYPPTVQPDKPKDLAAFLDWRYFKEWMVLEFIDVLTRMLVERGITEVPVVLNHPLEPPSWPVFYRRFIERGWQAILGPSLYGPRLRPLDLAHIVNAMEFVKASGAPTVFPETGVGYWVDDWYVAPGDVDLTFKALIGHGLNGFNFLEFSGGENPRGYGSQYYEWQAPVASDGSLRESYPVVREIGRFAQTHGEQLLLAEKVYDVAIGSYAPYHALQAVPTKAAGLKNDISRCGEYTLQLGTLFLLGNVNYGIADIETSSVEHLLRWRQLWVLSYDFMGAEVQSKLVEYVQRGGHLVLLPDVPYLDEKMEPCLMLSSTLFPGALKSRKDKEWFDLDMLLGTPRVSSYECLNHYELPEDAVPVALDEGGEAVGYTQGVGSGRATILGTHLRFVHNVHPTLFPTFLSANGIERCCYAEDARILVTQRSTESYSYVSVLNLYETPISTRIIVTDPKTKARIKISEGTPVTVPARSGLILGLRLPLPDGAGDLLCSTSQVTELTGNGREIMMRLAGARGMKGESIVKMSWDPGAVYVNGKPAGKRAVWDASSRTLTVTYTHRLRPVEIRFARPFHTSYEVRS